ncbi:MAG: metal-dependent transcriptional regulator [Planctomycetota bacterium]|nr:metal-dependent transcriptional regulator [Planctomycetota bacterium]
MPSESEENYLRALWKLSGVKDQWITTGKLADRVGVSHPSATRMAGRLGGHGWVEHEPYRGVRLTHSGRALALQTVRRHRILETYISKILGVPWDQVDAEVERLEHAVSDDLVCRMEEALGFPARDPHGSPIPDRDGCLPATAEEIILTEAPIAVELEIVRVIDSGPEVLQWLGERGVTPGSRISIEAREPGGGPLLLISKELDRPIALSGTLARSIEVRSIDL